MSFGRSSPRSSRRPSRLAALPPAGEVVLGTVTLVNNGSAAVQPRARFGMAWTRSRFPGTHRIRARVQGGAEVAFAALVGRNRWTDGSIKTTADGGVVIHDADPLAAGQSRTYELFATAGAQGTSGFDPWAWITAHANDFTVEVTNRTGSQTGAMGNLSFGLKAAIGTATRREIVADTPRFVRVKAWQMVSGEDHLVCEFHVDFWLDGSGTPLAVEWCPVLSQHWYVADPFGSGQPKQRQNYDATVRYGTTVLDTRTGLQHAYHCRWASVRSANDPQHARKHWINLSGNDPIPTIRVQYSLSTLRELMRVGAAPAIRQDLVPTLTSDATYAPLSTQWHRAVINGTGAYIGRGVWSAVDCDVLIHQSGGTGRNPDRAWRNARVNAQAGLAAFFHFRDHRTVGGDVANRIIPWPMRQITGGTQSYAGLGAPVICTNGVENPSPYTALTRGAANGGTGAFSAYDAAHAVDYSGPIAFLEGEHYLGDAARSHLAHTAGYISYNQYGHDRGLRYAGTALGNAWGVPEYPTVRFGQMINMGSQTREPHWGCNVLRAALLVTDDRMPEEPLFRNALLNVDKFYSDSFGYFSASYRERGCTFVAHGNATVQHWQSSFGPPVNYMVHRLMHDVLPQNARGFGSGFQEAAFLDGRFIVNFLRYAGPYQLARSSHNYALDAAGINPFPANRFHALYSCTVTNDVWTADFPGGAMNWYMTNGDVVYMARGDVEGQSLTPPAPFQLGVPYYVVNASGVTFQLAATPGGAPITGITGPTSVGVQMQPSVYHDRTTVGPSGQFFWPSNDSNMLIANACLEACRGNGHDDYTTQLQNRWTTFMAPWFSNPPGLYSAWLWDGSLLDAE